MSKYLLEIGVEEFPATYIEPTKLQLEEAFTKLLQDNGVDFHALQTAATPRRLVVRIDGLHNRTEGKTTEVRGPAVRIAYDEQGRPTKALAGFMRSQQVQEDGIFTRDVNGESYVFAQKTEEGKDVKQLLRDGIPEILRHLRFPKSMKWGGRDFRFARPIRWFVSLFDDDVLPFDLEEIPVGRFTRGHRVLGSDRIEVESIERFEDQLLDNFVMLDEQKRKELILLQAERLVRERGGNLMQDEALLDEIVNLVEYPTPLLGQIPAEYMDLPDTVILTPMKDHLRYIPVLDDKGDPMPYFVTVRNGDKTGLDTVREGNERVLTPRLEDAKFFYKEDRKQPLSAGESFRSPSDTSSRDRQWIHCACLRPQALSPRSDPPDRPPHRVRSLRHPHRFLLPDAAPHFPPKIPRRPRTASFGYRPDRPFPFLQKTRSTPTVPVSAHCHFRRPASAHLQTRFAWSRPIQIYLLYP
jgi:glycyl-tRNA synthetase beta chain